MSDPRGKKCRTCGYVMSATFDMRRICWLPRFVFYASSPQVRLRPGPVAWVGSIISGIGVPPSWNEFLGLVRPKGRPRSQSEGCRDRVGGRLLPVGVRSPPATQSSSTATASRPDQHGRPLDARAGLPPPGHLPHPGGRSGSCRFPVAAILGGRSYRAELTVVIGRARG